MAFSDRCRSQSWRPRLRPDVLRRLLLLLLFFGTAANLKNCWGVMALTTVLDPRGFPFLLGVSPAGGGASAADDRTRGRGGGGGLQRIELVYLVRSIYRRRWADRGVHSRRGDQWGTALSLCVHHVV